MNRTIMVLLFKFIAMLSAAWVSFGLIDNSPIRWILIIALVGTTLNYLIGDLFVLPTFGNLVASLGDGIMAMLTAYVLDLFWASLWTSFRALIVFGLIVVVAEYFFHIYLRRSDKVAL